MGLTIHFDKTVPDKLEQWLSTEARYIITTFSKPAELQKVFGDRANKIVADCKQRSENVVESITLVLGPDLKKLASAAVHLQNGESFLVNERYALLQDEAARATIEATLGEDGPGVFKVINR